MGLGCNIQVCNQVLRMLVLCQIPGWIQIELVMLAPSNFSDPAENVLTWLELSKGFFAFDY